MKIDKKWKPTLAYYTDEEVIDLLDKENTITTEEQQEITNEQRATTNQPYEPTHQESDATDGSIC